MLAAATAIACPAHPGEPTGFDPAHLFPTPFFKGFTTAPNTPTLPNDAAISHVDLSDKALNVVKVTSGVTHDVVIPADAPAGTAAWEAFYPNGSYTPSHQPRGGFGFYFPGPTGFTFEGAKEILFSYAVKFQDDFMFNKGGKLPGPYGGANQNVSYACSGGRHEDRDQCFDLRLMWRADGAGEIYAYLPNVPENDVLLDIPGTVKDTSFGWSIARGAFSFVSGKWTVLAQRVRLNDVGAANGELELFVDGVSTIRATQLVISQNDTTTVRGVHAQTFFGGGTEDWASQQDQKGWFADMSGAIIA